MGTQFADDDSVSRKNYTALPTLKLFHESPAQIRCCVGPVGCLSADTEFLSVDGWKKIDRYQEGEEVAQWDHISQQASFVKPLQYIIEECSEFWHFHNKHSLSMIVSDEHRVPLYDYQDRFIVKEASALAKNPSRHTVPINYLLSYPRQLGMSDDLIRLAVAIHADGYVEREGKSAVRFDLRKSRKKDRLRALLSSLDIQYSDKTYPGRPTEAVFRFKSPYVGKHFRGKWWAANTEELSIVVDEMRYWDGLGSSGAGDVRFTTTHKKDADYIQHAVHATGGRATISMQKDSERNPNWNDGYIVHIAEKGSSKASVMFRVDSVEVSRLAAEDGKKYCFVVPTSFFLARCNDRIFITGNSGKTTAAAWEGCFYIPWFLFKTYGIVKTRGVIIRNTYAELIDTTQRTLFDWFDWGDYKTQAKNYTLKYPQGPEIEILFRSCDRPQDVKKFKSLEITWYWIDESIEVADEVKKMLKNRLGRFPRKCPVRFGIETTNPPDVEHPTYYQFQWHALPPGPVTEKKPLANHEGFWQPPHENDENLRDGYYNELRLDYADSPDWIDMYIDGKPGVIVHGKLVYNNFRRNIHVASNALLWDGGKLYRGWDDSGNTPACIIVSNPTPGRLHFMREYCHDKMNIVSFAKYVVNDCNTRFPGAEWTDFDDPAGWNTFSKKEGGFTSNANLIQEATGVQMIASEQNLTARLNSIDDQLALIDGVLIDPSCIRFVNGFLGGYCYPQVGLTGEYSDSVDKNRFSHIHDAAQYVAVRLVKQTRRVHKKMHRRRRVRAMAA